MEPPAVRELADFAPVWPREPPKPRWCLGSGMSRLRSPITVETARRLYDYNSAVFGRYVRSARRLPWRVATADRGTGHRSVFQTLVHILNVHEVWITYLAQGRTEELESLFQQPGRKPSTWEDFGVYMRRVWGGISSYMAGVNATQLSRRIRAPWMPGNYTVGDAVLQTSFEQAHHLGEIIGIYWQRDREPPEMTWMDVERGSPR